jgi:hypothetical protein
MLKPELFAQARWQDLYDFLAAGQPPIAMRLLVINTIFLMLFVYRRANGRPRMNEKTTYAVQSILILANCFLMFSGDIQNLSHWARGLV